MPKGKPAAKWVRFTEEQNALDYLEKAHQALQRVDSLPTEWKWVILGLHSSVYAFGICVLKGSNWEWVTVKTKAGKHRLIGFDETIKRCQEQAHMGYFVHSKPLVLTAEQKEAIRWFKKYRDYFEHYIPLYWSILKQDLPVLSIEMLEVIRFLALESGNVHLSEHERNRVQQWIAKDKKQLQGSQLYKDYLAAVKKRARRKGGS